MRALGRSFLVVAILGTLGLLAGCNGSTPNGASISISVSANPTTINPGQTSAVTATVTGDSSNSGVTWSLSGVGSLSNQTSTAVTYTAPSSLSNTTIVSVTATSVANTSVVASVNIQVNGTAGNVVVSLAASPTTINQGGTSAITATVTGDSTNAGVTWSQPSIGTLTNETSTSATYNAPSVGSPTEVVIAATSKADSGAAASTQITVLVAGAAANVQAVNVDGGPVPIYPNGGFASATVCVPGSTTSCVTIDGLLVDTESIGLRVLGTALNGLALQPIQVGGQNLNDCVQFGDGSYLWGQVESADVHLSGETASNIPIHVVADPVGYSIPTACSNGGTDEDNQAALGTNGILGVGPEPNDCTLAGVNYCNGSSPVGIYWTCTSSGCTTNPVTVPIAQQVTNPVVAFATDNNGVVLTFPSVTAPSQATVTGTMTFGIGTQSNNQLTTQTVYTLDANGNFQTTLTNGPLDGQFYPASFLDSGSNGYFIPDPSEVIPVCSDNNFFCPTSNLPGQQALNQGANGAIGAPVTYEIDNADGLFNNSSNAVYPTLGGPNGSESCPGGNSDSLCSLDWGLPFYYGNTVFTAIDGQAVPSGQPAAPWWAY